MNQQMAIERAKGLMESGMTVADANVELVRLMGVRIVSKLDRATRSALMDGVKSGKLGHLKKDGMKPEAFFHPNAMWNAKDERNKIACSTIQSIRGVFA